MGEGAFLKEVMPETSVCRKSRTYSSAFCAGRRNSMNKERRKI